MGAVRPGYKADLILIDLDDVAYLPYNSAARQLVYSESGRGVETVIVDGRVVIKNRCLETIDEEALRREVRALMRHFISDYDRVVEQRSKRSSTCWRRIGAFGGPTSAWIDSLLERVECAIPWDGA